MMSKAKRHRAQVVRRPPHQHPPMPGHPEVIVRHGPATLTATVASAADLRTFAMQGRHGAALIVADLELTPVQAAVGALSEALRTDLHLRGKSELCLRLALSLVNPARLHDRVKLVAIDLPLDEPEAWTVHVDGTAGEDAANG